MKTNSQKTRNRPFRDWVNKFPVSRRKQVMEIIADGLGKSYQTVRSYKNMLRDIPALECAGIQMETRIISEKEGIDGFVTARSIYPELYEAFKQGDKEVPHESTTTDTPTNPDQRPSHREGMAMDETGSYTAAN